MTSPLEAAQHAYQQATAAEMKLGEEWTLCKQRTRQCEQRLKAVELNLTRTPSLGGVAEGMAKKRTIEAELQAAHQRWVACDEERKAAAAECLRCAALYEDARNRARYFLDKVRFHTRQVGQMSTPFLVTLETHDLESFHAQLAEVVGFEEAARCRDLSYKPDWVKGY